MDSVPGQLEEIRQRLELRERHVDARFDAGEVRMRAIESAMAENTVITREMSGTVNDIRDIVATGKAVKLVGAGATRILRWVGGIALAVSAIWALVQQAMGAK